MALFDTVIIVDWSSAKTPKRGGDSIWWALHRRGGGHADGSRQDGLQAIGNPTTRAEAVAILAHLIAAEADLGQRVLVGFDFPFGYPVGFARHVCGAASALALWDWLTENIADAPDNANDRFECAGRINALFDGPGPFWGRPAGADIPGLAERKAGIVYDQVPERRLVEQRVTRAQPVWKLFTTGSVGGQVLLGLPALNRLRRDARLRGRVAVWPFETGLTPGEAPVVLAEIYPSLLDRAIEAGRRDGEVKDAAQVRVTAAAYAALDDAGGLAPLFEAAADLTADERRIIETEEAWILGAGHEQALREAA